MSRLDDAKQAHLDQVEADRDRGETAMTPGSATTYNEFLAAQAAERTDDDED